MGVKMSDAILENLMPLAKVLDWEWGLEQMADDDRIVRFGLNAEFVDNAGLLWTKACEGLMATWPTLPRHPRDVERIADGCANHSLDAVRYRVQW